MYVVAHILLKLLFLICIWGNSASSYLYIVVQQGFSFYGYSASMFNRILEFVRTNHSKLRWTIYILDRLNDVCFGWCTYDILIPTLTLLSTRMLSLTRSTVTSCIFAWHVCVSVFLSVTWVFVSLSSFHVQPPLQRLPKPLLRRRLSKVRADLARLCIAMYECTVMHGLFRIRYIY